MFMDQKSFDKALALAGNARPIHPVGIAIGVPVLATAFVGMVLYWTALLVIGGLWAIGRHGLLVLNFAGSAVTGK